MIMIAITEMIIIIPIWEKLQKMMIHLLSFLSRELDETQRSGDQSAWNEFGLLFSWFSSFVSVVRVPLTNMLVLFYADLIFLFRFYRFFSLTRVTGCNIR
jgi:hypothetical protein